MPQKAQKPEEAAAWAGGAEDCLRKLLVREGPAVAWLGAAFPGSGGMTPCILPEFLLFGGAALGRAVMRSCNDAIALIRRSVVDTSASWRGGVACCREVLGTLTDP